MRGPDLGGHEHIIALDAGGAHAVADFALVLVDLRGVDVSIAKLERLLDQPCAGAAAQLPGAEPDRRDFCAVGFDELGLEWHEWALAFDRAPLCPGGIGLPTALGLL